MNTVQQPYEVPAAIPCPDVDLLEPRWYALHTRARHENMVTTQLNEKGIHTFLPLMTEMHRWSDRRKIVHSPLFPCYTFVNLNFMGRNRLTVLQTPGVLGFVGLHGHALPIPEKEINDVKSLHLLDAACFRHPYLQVGKRVRICSGSLNGVEGILLAKNEDHTLVVSISLIQQSVAVRIDGYEVEPI